MNAYDLAAMAAIQTYRDTHGNYPRFIEATAEHLEMMGYYYFEFPNTVVADEIIRVPVIEVGGAHRHILIRVCSNESIADARYMAEAHWARESARLLTVGLHLSEPRTRFGENYETSTSYYQITALIFGHETVLQEIMQEKNITTEQ